MQYLIDLIYVFDICDIPFTLWFKRQTNELFFVSFSNNFYTFNTFYTFYTFFNSTLYLFYFLCLILLFDIGNSNGWIVPPPLCDSEMYNLFENVHNLKGINNVGIKICIACNTLFKKKHVSKIDISEFRKKEVNKSKCDSDKVC